MTEWDGRERRQGWNDMEVHLAEIKRDVSYIKDRIDDYKKELDLHVRDDNKVHNLVTQHGSQITMLMWLFLAMLGVGVWKISLP